MHVARIRLKNCGPYRGEHELKLQTIAYAISAEFDGEPDRSNGAGKSWLSNTIRHALYGEHSRDTEDGWITNGESVGENELELSDGARILRSRHRGKPTRIYFWPPGAAADKPATQAEAQRLIEQHVGLSLRDFDATCYFEQKAMARLVLARPEERMEIVSAWLELAPLVEAEDAARARLAGVMDAASGVSQRCSSLMDERVRLLVDEAKRVVTELEEDEKRKRAEHYAQNQRKLDAQKRVGAFADAERFAQIAVEGKNLLAEIKKSSANPGEVEAARLASSEASAAHATIEAGRSKLVLAARGEFDGKCPVVPFDCPARAKINGMREESRRALDAWMADLSAARVRKEEAESVYSYKRAALDELRRKQGKLESLRATARELKPAALLVACASREIAEDELQSAKARAAEAEALWMASRDALAEKKRVVARLEAVEAELSSLREQAKEAEEVLDVHRCAVAVLGRNGAQRVVAEQALSDIEVGANDELAAAGIDLSVAVTWSREGDGLAPACDACGSPFPTSKKVRQCQRCGADRGPKLVNKLDIKPSRRSGGCDDLAGIYFQLSASRWLRARRGCQWATAIIDEPTSALDRSAQRAVGRHIASTLSATGFEQSFLVSHHPGVLDMLPGRIEVVSDGTFARVNVR